MRPAGVIVLTILMIILAFLGFASGTFFLTDPSGGSHGMDTSILKNTPIGDFTLVGLFFVIAYGVLPIVAIVGLWTLPRWRWTDPFNKWTKQNWAWGASVAIGAILIVWIVVEITYIGSPDGFPRFLQAMMATMGAVVIGMAIMPSSRKYAKLAA